MDPIELLARGDKWQLGAGESAIFAPPFPVWLTAPGFWDEATIFHYALAPVFTVACVADDGREVALTAHAFRWTPAEVTVEYDLANGMTATEVRTVQPDGVFASEWRFRAPSSAHLHVIAWTAQDAATVDLASTAWRGALTFARTLRDAADAKLPVELELACVGGATSWGAMLADGDAARPHWRATPFADAWRPEGLSREARLAGIERQGVVYAAVHRALPVAPSGASVAFALRVSPAAVALARGREPAATAHAPTLGGASRLRWQGLLACAPRFRCSDPYLETYYLYRWYVLWLAALGDARGAIPAGATAAGSADLHHPTAASAVAHARELRWLGDPSRARATLSAILAAQRDDGSLPASVYVDRADPQSFEHVDWGGALRALDATHPDDLFLDDVYSQVERYARWLAGARDAEGSGMIDVRDQCEAGALSPRFQAVDPAADRHHWEGRLRLKGIDATVYAYTLFRALEAFAPRTGRGGEAERWGALAERARRAVRARMWDAGEGMFFDVDARTAERTGVMAAACFLPYGTDLATAEHLPGLERHLFDPRRFWTEFPVPSVSADDPLFSPAAVWKGRRHAAPWNGRLWPAVNCQIVDALARYAVAVAPHLRARAAHLLRRFVHMMFDEGNPTRPNAYEHYDPVTGRGSLFRGRDDTQTSWVVDLVVQYVMGVRPHDGGITVDPFPFGLEQAELRGVFARGRTLDVSIVGPRFTVVVDGARRESPLGTAIEIPD